VESTAKPRWIEKTGFEVPKIFFSEMKTRCFHALALYLLGKIRICCMFFVEPVFMFLLDAHNGNGDRHSASVSQCRILLRNQYTCT
jgi:hypothetical protein